MTFEVSLPLNDYNYDSRLDYYQIVKRQKSMKVKKTDNEETRGQIFK